MKICHKPPTPLPTGVKQKGNRNQHNPKQSASAVVGDQRVSTFSQLKLLSKHKNRIMMVSRDSFYALGPFLKIVKQ